MVTFGDLKQTVSFKREYKTKPQTYLGGVWGECLYVEYG